MLRRQRHNTSLAAVFSESTIGAAETCVSEVCPRSGEWVAFSELVEVACAARGEAIFVVVGVLNMSEVGEHLGRPVCREHIFSAPSKPLGYTGEWLAWSGAALYENTWLSVPRTSNIQSHFRATSHKPHGKTTRTYSHRYDQCYRHPNTDKWQPKHISCYFEVHLVTVQALFLTTLAEDCILPHKTWQLLVPSPF